MTTLNQALQTILDNTIPVKTEKTQLANALGRVLAEPLYADRDFPPFDRVTMDGIAILYQSFESGQLDFPIFGVAAAGSPQAILENPKNCLEVMTGAMLPLGTDTVIRYEDLEINDGKATIVVDKIKSQQNVHAKGLDRTKGDLLVAPGKYIGPAEIGIAATIGHKEINVIKAPKTIVISTGDELVSVHERPAAHQIRRSNVHNIISALQQRGVSAEALHLNDDRPILIELLSTVLENFELVILSGGVSKGKFDYVPDVLMELGVNRLFHGVKQRPGKPFWFGSNGKSVVFALPGNPVSSYMCTTRFIQPWLDKTMNLPERKIPNAVLTNDFTFKPDLTYLLQVRVSYNDQGQILATPIEGSGSGDLANLTTVDAFLELPQGKNLFKKGEVYPLYLFKQ
ncbi:MAG: molybdopterin molybdotransferase MoeA [Saprospiraceae bacterium]